MLKIWGRNTSSNVQKVIWALAEMKLPFERVDVGGAFGKTKDPFYLAMNPNSLVPTLEEEDGFTMWESNSIVRYLAGKHQNRALEPADLKARAHAQMWMDWQLSVMAPAITPVFWGLIRTPPEKRDAKAIEEGRLKSNQLAAEVLERALEKNAYITDNRLSMGDIPIGCEVQRWMRCPIERPKLPNVEAWFGRLGQRAPFKKIVDIPLS
jgi:glutathione S-transferase